MEVHNTVEDKVIPRVNKIFDDLAKDDIKGKICTCSQCRMDVICYTLNRMPPHYIVSNRGASRMQNENIEHQQQNADIVSLVHEGLVRVNHNQRPNFTHSSETSPTVLDTKLPVYNIPTILGRVINGNNFAPLSDVKVELFCEGELVHMKDGNWQNPCIIVSKNEGNFSFWPAADIAAEAGKEKIFDYTLRVSSEGFETITHVFKVSVTSNVWKAGSFNLERTCKIPDLYLFPPGEEDKNNYLD